MTGDNLLYGRIAAARQVGVLAQPRELSCDIRPTKDGCSCFNVFFRDKFVGQT